MAEAQSLSELEQLLGRLYSPESSNEERLMINKLLDTFGQQDRVWRYCVYFLQHTTNQYILMYSLHIIESTVTRKWLSVDIRERAELRRFLMEFLAAQFTVLPAFVGNKLVQVVVLIGQVDWPHACPDLMEYITQLARSTDKAHTGLALMLAASEELATPKSDLLSTSRRRELHTLMLQQVPTFLSTIITTLKTSFSFISTTKGSAAPSAHIVTICQAALRCLNHLFSWIPLSNLITAEILDTVFLYASLGCCSDNDLSNCLGCLGSEAMDCVNELLVKNCVPREFESFLMKLFDQSFRLLQQLIGDDTQYVCDFSRLDDRYLAKCGDFFYWFVSSHLKRVEFNPNFPVLEFLVLFSKYTVRQPEIDSFSNSLETWGLFLDHLITMATETAPDHSPHSSNHFERYREVLVNMMSVVLRKIQWHYNINDLREIDDDTVDDDDETEWQCFLRQVLEFVGKVAELFPTEAFQLIVPKMEEYAQVYLSLVNLISRKGNERVLQISAGSECEKLHAVLKDLTSMLQAIGRLSDQFCGQHFIDMLEDAHLLIKNLCNIAQYNADNMLFNVDTPMPEILEHDFLELHAQTLGTLQAFQHWVSNVYLTMLRGSQPSGSNIPAIISSITTSAIVTISPDVPEKVSLMSCRLLLSIASTVRPHFLLGLGPVQHLIEQVSCGGLSQLPHRVNSMLHQALTAMFLLPWHNVPDSDQQWEVRYAELCKLVTGASAPIHQLISAPGWSQNIQLREQAKPGLKRSLLLLGDMVTSAAHECKRSKSLMLKSINPTVDTLIPLFPVFLHQPDVLDDLMGFFLTLFDGLLGEISAALVERMTQTFMTLLTRQHLEETILQENSMGNRVVEKFLRMLMLLVQETSVGEKAFLPSIISFTMKQIYPAISTKELPEVKSSLYDLLFQLLLNNWRHFFPSNVLAHMDKDENEPLQNEEDFNAIIEAFGQSFLQSDISIFRQNLQALETLNNKHKLFSKMQFRNSMWQPFLLILLRVLVNKSQNLLGDEICSCVFNMASINFRAFHMELLPAFLSSTEGLSEQQQLSLIEQYRIVEDLPSFVQNLYQFTSDLRYYLLINASLPANSVKLS